LLNRALIFYRSHGIRVKRVLADNAKAYNSHLFGAVCTQNHSVFTA
jgi:hypothetical protein